MDIRKVIKERGLTAKEVAIRLGIGETALNNRINRNTSVEKLREIADAIGCKVGDFFADEISSPSATTHPATLTCPHCGGKISIEAKPLQDHQCK